MQDSARAPRYASTTPLSPQPIATAKTEHNSVPMRSNPAILSTAVTCPSPLAAAVKKFDIDLKNSDPTITNTKVATAGAHLQAMDMATTVANPVMLILTVKRWLKRRDRSSSGGSAIKRDTARPVPKSDITNTNNTNRNSAPQNP